MVIVSSGAIGVALRLMDYERRPKHLPKVQALAAIGQCRLMGMWDQLFSHFRQPVAQILLTRNDIADRTQYLNAQNTLFELLNMGVIPIVNENDTLAVTEIKFGDNDTLSAITAGMVQADYLFLMTDVDCLYDKNPRTNPDAKPIEVVQDISKLVADVSSSGSTLGTGGMYTKIVAARLATSAGVCTVITRSSRPGNIPQILKYAEARKADPTNLATVLTGKCRIETERSGRQSERLPLTSTSNQSQEQVDLQGMPFDTKQSGHYLSPPPNLLENSSVPLHTRFTPETHPIRDRHFWLLHGLSPHGDIYIDEGAYRALSDKAGLLPAGVIDVEGNFAQQEAVRILVAVRKGPAAPEAALTYEKENPGPVEVGRALVNYSAAEIKRIRGMKSVDITNALGYADSEYVALRENIAFFKGEKGRRSTLIDGR